MEEFALGTKSQEAVWVTYSGLVLSKYKSQNEKIIRLNESGTKAQTDSRPKNSPKSELRGIFKLDLKARGRSYI